MVGGSKLSSYMTGEREPPPIAKLLGMRLVEFAEGAATFELDVDGRLYNPMGTLHGGILCDLADAAMGFAWASTLGEGETFTTIELKINFFKPVFTGRLRASAKLVKRGRTIGMAQCDVLDEKGSLVARVSSTLMTLRGEKAAGR